MVSQMLLMVALISGSNKETQKSDHMVLTNLTRYLMRMFDGFGTLCVAAKDRKGVAFAWCFLGY